MDKQTFELMHAVARKLTGLAVTIRFEEVRTDRPANGATYKGLDGTPVIVIDPYYEYRPEEVFRLLTHELAHVVKHFPIMARVDTADKTAVHHVINKTTNASAQNREDEAEALAEKWRKYALYNCEKYYGIGKLNSMLNVLLFDYKGE